jgi:hypothetical protein
LDIAEPQERRVFMSHQIVPMLMGVALMAFSYLAFGFTRSHGVFYSAVAGICLVIAGTCLLIVRWITGVHFSVEATCVLAMVLPVIFGVGYWLCGLRSSGRKPPDNHASR